MVKLWTQRCRRR